MLPEPGLVAVEGLVLEQIVAVVEVLEEKHQEPEVLKAVEGFDC